MEKEYNTYPPFTGFDNPDLGTVNDIYKDPMFNPVMQYEQAFTYYKYLCMQMDYKIKCKEYENMCQKEKPRRSE